MGNIHLSLPKELRDEMDKYPKVNWSRINQLAVTAYIQKRKNIEQFQKTQKELARRGK